MKKKELYKMSFEDACEKLMEESNTLTSYELLKGFICKKIDEDNIGFAYHLIKAIWEDETIGDTDYYDYDYTCGTLDTPRPVKTLEDLEEYCED